MSLSIDDQTMPRLFDPIVIAEIWAHLGEAWRRRPDAFSSAFAATFKAPPPSAAVVAEARRSLAAFRTATDRIFDRIDVLLTPTVPVTAPLIEGPIDGALILRNTWVFNALGTPAVSIPCGTDGLGLPIGLQLVARRGQDERLLNIARAAEREINARSKG